MNKEIKESIEILWNFHKISNDLQKSDMIFGLGSVDIETAVRCAELYLEGLAPKIVFSGGVTHSDDLLATAWTGTEAEAFAAKAMSLGVPQENIILENKATNTGENITLTYGLLEGMQMLPKSVILIQKPYMGKRTYATFKKQWKDEKTRMLVSSPQVSIEKYIFSKERAEQEKIINTMVGDMDRIVKYPKLGFQVEIPVPDSVLEAMDVLVKVGFNKRLVA